MAKIRYTNDLSDYENLGSFDPASLKLAAIRATSLTFRDGDGARMVLHGSDIARKGSAVTDGRVTSAEFYNADGDRIYTFKNVDADAVDIYKAFSFDKSPNRVMHGLMQGDDVVVGSKFDDSLWGFNGNDILKGGLGDDFLYGHAGNDRLTGGKGSDHFTFLSGTGHDTVTDFDAKGRDHDFIYMDYYLYGDMTITKHGANLLLEMENGEQLTLEGVKKSQLTIDHFDFY